MWKGCYIMNKLIIKGNLVKDPDYKSGKKDKQSRCSISVAVNRSYDREKADFFFCTAFGKTADFIDEYFSKGDSILICGRMESYKNDDDQTCWAVAVESVEFASAKNSK